MSMSLGRRLLLAFYSALLWLLVPVTLYHLVWRGLRQREYLLRWSYRYAQLDALPDQSRRRCNQAASCRRAPCGFTRSRSAR